MNITRILLFSFLLVLCSCYGSGSSVESIQTGNEDDELNNSFEEQKECFGILPTESILIQYPKNQEEPNSLFWIYAVNNQDSEELRLLQEIQTYNSYEFTVIMDEKVYFPFGNPQLGGYYQIKYFDAVNCEILNTGIKTYDTFDLSENGDYLGTVQRGDSKDTPWGVLYLPFIEIFNLNTKESIVYDFQHLLLKDG